MSLFDTFDPHSEELIKVNQQRSFRETEEFPGVVIGRLKRKPFKCWSTFFQQSRLQPCEKDARFLYIG